MPTCYQLIGVPAAGKSTWVQAQAWMQDYAYISTDKFVDAHAELVDKTYNEVFHEVMKHAVELMAQEVVAARDAGKNIVWDQTSCSISSRKKKFNMLKDYEHVAVVFKTPETKELHRRLAGRPGKNIPLNVVEQMARDLEMEPPALEEGFKEIWFAQ